MSPILSAIVGANADLLPSTLELYVPEGPVLDVTWGQGAFWRHVDVSRWQPVGSDLVAFDGCRVVADFRCLPYADASATCIILDPPYMHGGSTVKSSINRCYRNDETDHSHAAVVQRYALGMIEAKRVLQPGGVLLIKCQDETVGGKQRRTHIEILALMDLLELEDLDLRFLVQDHDPCMRHGYQLTSRKNLSFMWVARKRGRRPPAARDLP